MSLERTHLFIAEDDKQITRAWKRRFTLEGIPFFLVTSILEARDVWDQHYPIIAIVAIDGYLEDGATTGFIRHALRPKFEGDIVSITGNANFIPNMLNAGCSSHIVKNEAVVALVRMMKHFKHSSSPLPSASSNAP